MSQEGLIELEGDNYFMGGTYYFAHGTYYILCTRLIIFSGKEIKLLFNLIVLSGPQ